MKKNTISFLIILFIILFCGVSLSWAGGSIKVRICHIPPGDPSDFHTITVAEKALEAHLAHGDFLGSCDENCDIICDDGDPCTQDVDPTANDCTCLSVPILVDCEDGNFCTTDICDSTTGGCVNDPIDCGRGDACTSTSCDPIVGCISETLSCPDDNDPCTDDTCDPVQGCLYENICNDLEANCSDAVDNDNDGFTDCEDADCSANIACSSGEFNCNDLSDNDNDGFTDCEDADCSFDSACN